MGVLASSRTDRDEVAQQDADVRRAADATPGPPAHRSQMEADQCDSTVVVELPQQIEFSNLAEQISPQQDSIVQEGGLHQSSETRVIDEISGEVRVSEADALRMVSKARL